MKLALAFAMLLAASGATSTSIADNRPSDKAVRKGEPPPDKLAAAAGEAFGKAKAADEAGNLDEAVRLYRKALAISPHPFTQYNLADVLRRRKDVKGAIDAYKKYLEMDPGAKDRNEVERLIKQLDALPGTMIIEVEESDAQVFINGEPVKKTTPFEVPLPAGDYTVDVVTAISHDNERCQVYHGSKRTCRMRLKPREDGNVILSGPPNMYRASMGRSGEPTIKLKQRFHLDPGRHKIYVTSSRERQCAPLDIDVAKGDVVTYVWADVPAKWPQGRGECADVKFKRRVLKF